MKRKIVLVATAVLLVGGGAGAYYSSQTKDQPEPTSSSTNTAPTNTSPDEAAPRTSEAPKAEKACDILTQEIAKKVLGDSAKAADSNNEAPKDSDHVIITTCTYNSADNARTASLLMRVAKDAEGSAHDKEQFGPNKPVGSEEVSGYGDAAYWDINFKQLNILKGTTWYVITNGSAQTPERTLDQAKQLADLLAPKL